MEGAGRLKKKIFLFLAACTVLLLCGCTKDETEKFDGYSIKVGECIYNSMTKTGSVELKVTGKKLGLEKLFYTSEDIVNNGLNDLVEEGYHLQISNGERSLESQAYELNYENSTQTVKVYYVNPENSLRKDKFRIEIVDGNSVVQSMRGNLKIEEKCSNYLCDNAPYIIRMSSTGLLVDSGEILGLEEGYRRSDTVTLKSADQEYMLAVDENTKLKETEHLKLLQAKLYKEIGNIHIYALDVRKWKEIEQVVVDDYIYINENMPEQAKNAGKIETFYTDDLSDIAISSDWKIQDCYITNKRTGTNYYRIDENHVLWGSGYNQYGQLGINHPEDTNSVDVIYEQEQKIAENVIHVDSSWNGYFTIYITEDGKLYGMGANLQGVMREYINGDDESDPWRNIVYTPKLLMEHVRYARAGMECVTVLKEDGEVYWWGEFWEKDSRQPDWEEPHLMLEHAVYTVTGDNHAGAITEDGELYVWGINQWGQCGAGEDTEYVTEPEKVADDVRMVWCDELRFNAVQTEWNNYPNDDMFATRYNNTFILKEDNRYYAAGKDMGDHVLSVGAPEDMPEGIQDTETGIRYSPNFLPIRVEEK